MFLALIAAAYCSFDPSASPIPRAWGFLPTRTRTITRTRTRTTTSTTQDWNYYRVHHNGRTKRFAESNEAASPRDQAFTSSSVQSQREQTNMSESSPSTSPSLKNPNDQKAQRKKNRIVSIRCENLAGMTSGRRSREILEDNEHDNGVVIVNFDQGAATTTTTTATATREDEQQDEDNNNKSSITTESGEGNLVCITGETGSGKSLLVSKIADLLTGGKASAFLLPSNTESTTSGLDGGDENDDEAKITLPPSATVEMVLSLHDRVHQAYVRNALRQMGLDPNKILFESDEDKDGDQNQERKVGITVLRLKRVISLSSTSTNNNKTNFGQQRQRVRSNCFINDQPVTLKVLKAIVSPLIAIVNAPVAAAALGRPASRLLMIDSGIPSTILAEVHRLQIAYRKRKRVRQSLEKELKNRVLPASMIRRGSDGDDTDTGVENEQHFDLLRHWIEELDGFERRISDVKDSLCFGGNSSTQRIAEPELFFLLSELDALDWTIYSAVTTESSSDRVGGDSYTSSLYETLLDLHDYLKTLDARIIAATEARDSLVSLSASDSARTALDRTRQLLLDAAAVPQQNHFDKFNQNARSTPTTLSEIAKSRVDAATEQAHEMLNLVEDALLECSRVLDDDEKGLVATLRASRRACSTSTEELLEYITEWNILGRKHGVSPYQLPLCHETLRNELGGGVEAGKLLPEAKIAEKKALSELREGCRILSEARSILCQRITASISRRLPRLGMENSKFEARLSQINNPSYTKSHLGADEVDFYLLHDYQGIRNITSTANSRRDSKNQLIGGKIENVASSGEKARILLAIECEIPGSISAIGGTSSESYTEIEGDQLPIVSPVAVIYDEIDAHVGGRASISVAQMLFDQSKACQVLSITHSPSLAAIADTHICVHRGTRGDNGRLFDIVANPVHGAERRKELARMASGDLIADEAEVFADALLRDASSIKGRSQNLQPSD